MAKREQEPRDHIYAFVKAKIGQLGIPQGVEYYYLFNATRRYFPQLRGMGGNPLLSAFLSSYQEICEGAAPFQRNFQRQDFETVRDGVPERILTTIDPNPNKPIESFVVTQGFWERWDDEGNPQVRREYLLVYRDGFGMARSIHLGEPQRIEDEALTHYETTIFVKTGGNEIQQGSWLGVFNPEE